MPDANCVEHTNQLVYAELLTTTTRRSNLAGSSCASCARSLSHAETKKASPLPFQSLQVAYVSCISLGTRSDSRSGAVKPRKEGPSSLVAAGGLGHSTHSGPSQSMCGTGVRSRCGLQRLAEWPPPLPHHHTHMLVCFSKCTLRLMQNMHAKSLTADISKCAAIPCRSGTAIAAGNLLHALKSRCCTHASDSLVPTR